MTYTWSVRVRAESRKASRALARNHSFRVGAGLSFEPSDELPSALEHLLAALASDLLTTFQTFARRRRIIVDNAEISLNCHLENPLVHLGVIGEEGTPAVKTIQGVMYVSAEAKSDEDLTDAWDETLLRSPIYATLSRAASIDIRFQPTA